MPNKHPYVVQRSQLVTQIKTTYHLVYADSDEEAEHKCFMGDHAGICGEPAPKVISASPTEYKTVPSDDTETWLLPELSHIL